jgi:hypothetical protein
MGNDVFANGREVACKAGSGKSICAFPDVCFTPPQTPATPPGVPIPYPNTGMDSDTTDGSSTVKVGGQEAMLKNKSYFKKSTGDEAGSAPKKGVVTSVIQGKVYFIAWSMDVMIEGENVVRHMDMTTHNHASPVANTPPQIFAARMAMANIKGCEQQAEDVKKACGDNGEKFSCPDQKPLKDAKTARQAAKTAAGASYKKNKAYLDANKAVDGTIDDMTAEHEADDCRKKMRCLLSPYEKDSCCPGQTPHHLVEAGAFHDEGRGEMMKKATEQVVFVKSMFAPVSVEVVKGPIGDVPSRPVVGAEKYDQGAAPCVCCEGESQNQGTHKLLHQAQEQSAIDAVHVPNPNPMRPMNTASGQPAKMQRLDSAIDSGTNAVQAVFPASACDPGCIKAQLEEYHYKKAGMNPELPIKAVNGQGKAMPAP